MDLAFLERYRNQKILCDFPRLGVENRFDFILVECEFLFIRADWTLSFNSFYQTWAKVIKYLVFIVVDKIPEAQLYVRVTRH
ncbi:hypothetical protein BpHYR1_013240 [Brachionus plicatilis]|uniref:Uncharacterized protein n=1 Tax=Brachionus plicatilis TaxID=10195 RepID=A0A3M7S0R2_BRAPC|nr:hypothetical protein BpHYR1_013240 [Brachionus plicatilis]